MDLEAKPQAGLGNARGPRIVMPILAHADPRSLAHFVENARLFCPRAWLVLYNSGEDPGLGRDLGVELFPRPRRLHYAKVAQFYIDVFEWLFATGRDYDLVVTVETDMLFIRKGFEAFVAACMERHDYMAPNLSFRTPKTSRWRPIRSLRPELARWREVFGFGHTHAGFSPGQVFSKNYVETLLNHDKYGEVQALIRDNKSYSLQEVLFPTLLDVLGVPGRNYPEELRPVNRYRPYQAVSGVRRALSIPTAYFVHPVRRDPEDPARAFILGLQRP